MTEFVNGIAEQLDSGRFLLGDEFTLQGQPQKSSQGRKGRSAGAKPGLNSGHARGKFQCGRVERDLGVSNERSSSFLLSDLLLQPTPPFLPHFAPRPTEGRSNGQVASSS